MRFGLGLRFNRSKVSPVQRLVFDFEGRCASHVLQRLNAVIDLDQMLSHQSLRSRQHIRTHTYIHSVPPIVRLMPSSATLTFGQERAPWNAQSQRARPRADPYAN